LKLLTETGIDRIHSYLETLTDDLCERLANGQYRIVSSRERNEKSQVVCIQHTSGLSPMNLYSHLKDRGIITAPRGDRLRISPHLYNTAEEIDALVNALP
jgi:selenocysteine lyase/cysteine desulfurase